VYRYIIVSPRCRDERVYRPYPGGGKDIFGNTIRVSEDGLLSIFQSSRFNTNNSILLTIFGSKKIDRWPIVCHVDDIGTEIQNTY